MAITKTIESLRLGEGEIQEVKKLGFDKLFTEFGDDFQKKIDALLQIVNGHLGSQDKIYMANKKVWYMPCVVALLPDLDEFYPSSQRRRQKWQFDDNWKKEFSGFRGELPTCYEVLKFFIDGNVYQGNNTYFSCKKSNYNYYGLAAIDSNKDKKMYGIYDGSFYKVGYTYGPYYDEHHAIIPIFRLNGVDSAGVTAAKTISLWLKHDLVPDIEGFDTKTYNMLLGFYQINAEYIISDQDSLKLNKKLILDDCVSGKIPPVLQASFEKYLYKQYLECDYRRAGLDAYDERLLKDINRGHWDLWYRDGQNDEEDGDKPVEIKLQEGILARDPHDDIQQGTVAIDFGTKSTVVVYGDGVLNNLPLQIGNGNYGTADAKQKYENPTVVQFIDMDAFNSAYAARDGRPYTSWNDVVVSHQAFDNMMGTDSAGYNCFVDNLKQWCSTPRLRIKIKDRKGKVVDLPEFADLGATAFNPLEIYAYYIGIYINNMLGKPKIYRHYVMSFPVTFEKSVKENILSSFKKGLLKSMPLSLVQDEDFVKKFIVEEGTSEPAAYAATALAEGKMEPEDDDDCIYYGVFDFGGGTTDFDFGVYCYADDSSRYDYELTHFGANGDRTLGGENLLKHLAFRVFEYNKKNLRGTRNIDKKEVSYKIPFTLDADFNDFFGSRDYIEESQAAYQNMHNLVEKLRPVWEKPDSEETKQIINSGNKGFEVNLVDTNNVQQPNCKLFLGKLGDIFGQAGKDDGQKEISKDSSNQNATNDVESLSGSEDKGLSETKESKGQDKDGLDLMGIIKERVGSGVHKFFLAMHEAFDQAKSYEIVGNLEEVEKFIIFLAGNSSKAKIVTDVFEEYISKEGAATDKLKEILGNKQLPIFEIKPPLGMDSNDYERPNGKTGVAFGLLKCLNKGTGVKVCSINPNGNEISLQYYVGKVKRGKFVVSLSPTTKLQKWERFVDASDDFEIYYTKDPSALQKGISVADIEGMKMQTVLIPEDERNQNGFVYLQAVSSNKIAWRISESEEDLGNRGVEPKTIELE